MQLVEGCSWWRDAAGGRIQLVEGSSWWKDPVDYDNMIMITKKWKYVYVAESSLTLHVYILAITQNGDRVMTSR